jgi:hypothetical protein
VLVLSDAIDGLTVSSGEEQIQGMITATFYNQLQQVAL